MDESRNANGASKAGLVLGIFFLVFIFILFKFGKDKETVYNQQINPDENISREQVKQDLKSQQDSRLWGKYIDIIFESNEAKGTILSQDLSEEYRRELENRVLLPEETLIISGDIMGNSYAEKAKYLNQFEALFVSAGKRGVFTEAKLFALQAGGEGTDLDLSDYDKGTVLRLATEYELWAKEILKLDTPEQYVNRSLRTAQDILHVAFILRKAVAENDDQVYVMWIGKYTQKVFDILAVRYVK